MQDHHNPGRRTTRRTKTISQRADEHKATNIEVARRVLDDPSQHDPLTVEWARLVLGKEAAS
jgi:hypothetical protein